MKFTWCLVFIAVVFSTSHALGQTEPVQKLLSAKSLKCQFRPGTIAEWKETKFKVDNDKWQGETYYDSIDINQQQARLIGNQGAVDVMVLPSPAGITFLEATSVGNVNFTTVYSAYCGPPGNFCAVMSRHMNLRGTPLSSQYHGTCRVWQ